MKISIISFTNVGSTLNSSLRKILIDNGFEAQSYSMGKRASNEDVNVLGGSLKNWAERAFKSQDGIIFIGACAIAIRSIAPFLESKTKDPAVIVIDEKGNYIIPILSGHIGGGNELAKKIASYINGQAVITTATDINSKFAVDVFASKNDLYIKDMTIAKEISAEILNGGNVGLISDIDIKGEIPEEISVIEENHNTNLDLGISITSNETIKPFPKTLFLIARIFTIGIGCRKDKDSKEIEDALLSFLIEHDISIHAIKNIASIDLKKDERGILNFVQKYNICFDVYSNKELIEVQGDFSESKFVEKTTGLDCVCERAAVKGSGDGKLIIKKTIINGVTIAAALRKVEVKFE